MKSKHSNDREKSQKQIAETNNLLDKNLGHAARLAHIGTQRKCCPHTKTPPMSLLGGAFM